MSLRAVPPGVPPNLQTRADRRLAEAVACYCAEALPPDAPPAQVEAIADAFHAGMVAGLDVALWISTEAIAEAEAEPQVDAVSGVRLAPLRRPR